MKRSHFLIFATLMLCLLPVLGTLADTSKGQQQIVQLGTHSLGHHY
ncbi:hypothetical protein [Pseudooceanicola sp.]|nr:hypothetical protein [Pseudooceanicola sp.]MDF1854547.1 hypothetical protein [Pseudooceanicola sp.]